MEGRFNEFFFFGVLRLKVGSIELRICLVVVFGIGSIEGFGLNFLVKVDSMENFRLKDILEYVLFVYRK